MWFLPRKTSIPAIDGQDTDGTGPRLLMAAAIKL